ncbi:hypothetical protein GCM10011380_00390 [Sphingomonas metalli]|uniref:Uncharacterized protein n=1 Tax=Sphingomonas metalli TaxID=1779358 RepID=A0A916STD3_9SPHN|nr:hypothetical protein [Sphingomonas metalli]GGB14906.1 hypothetical protein GCM10011380_00390 [Sphingomonas metalli]
MTGCLDCGKPISAGAKRCKRHANALRNGSPEMRENSSKRMRARQAAGMPRNNAAISSALKAFYADPAEREKMVERGRKAVTEWTPEMKARRGRATAEGHRRRQEQRLAWCPLDRRDELAKLCRRYGAEEGRRIMREDLAAKERKRLAGMTSHEIAMERLAKGSKLVTVHPMRKADAAFTLGGVASGTL